MFKHPEGQPHPRPPVHLKKVGRYNFGEKILGDNFSEIKNFLTQKKYFNSTSEESLAAQLRNFIYKLAIETNT